MATFKYAVALSLLIASTAAQPEIDAAIKLAEEQDAQNNGDPIQLAQAAADATNAHRAAETAKQAAHVANKVAKHSIKITESAKSALQNAHDALHRARVDAEGLTSEQSVSLKKAEKKLKEATKDAEYGQVKQAKYVKGDTENKNLDKLEKKMDAVKAKKEKGKANAELEAMRKELEELRQALKEKGDTSDDEALKELQKQIEEMEKAEAKEDKMDAKSHDEMKAEIETLREQIEKLKKSEAAPKKADKKADKKEKKKPDAGDDAESESKATASSKDLDIDSQMPYGDLEPFGREDTAQELTEDSITQSDKMVDQLERAEVSEEKRAVFRALTRLRGAAITSFDGVARSQTGNIDEYNKVNQWRTKHPIHHLADEESDVTKWAFPDNADFLQKGVHPTK